MNPSSFDITTINFLIVEEYCTRNELSCSHQCQFYFNNQNKSVKWLEKNDITSYLEKLPQTKFHTDNQDHFKKGITILEIHNKAEGTNSFTYQCKLINPNKETKELNLHSKVIREYLENNPDTQVYSNLDTPDLTPAGNNNDKKIAEFQISAECMEVMPPLHDCVIIFEDGEKQEKRLNHREITEYFNTVPRAKIKATNDITHFNSQFNVQDITNYNNDEFHLIME